MKSMRPLAVVALLVLGLLFSSIELNGVAAWIKGTTVESVLNWLSEAWFWIVIGVMALAMVWGLICKSLDWLDARERAKRWK